jgi:hypothetical protein
MSDEKKVTKHARYRMNQRKIPDALIHEAIEKGKKAYLPDRQAIEYRLNNVLGFRNRHLVVITSLTGQIITSFVDVPEKSRQFRQRREKK